MTVQPTPAQPEDPRNYFLSAARTVVPLLWGYVLTFLARLSPELAEAFSAPPVVSALTVTVAALWYLAWRRIEPHLPAWLTRLVMGADSRPVYVPPPGEPGHPGLVIPRQAEGR
jgi:hypothetical protein